MEIRVLASGSGGNSYLVNDGASALLLDAGISFKEIQRGLGFQVSSLAGALVSHSHQDHCKAVPDLTRAAVDCYMSRATYDELGLTSHRVRIVKPLLQLQIGTFSVLPFDTKHDVPNLGFVLQSRAHKLLYLTDTPYCKYRFHGLTHMLLETNYEADLLQENVRAGAVHPVLRRRIRESHMSLESVKTMLLSNDLSRIEAIYLIHLSAGNSNAEQFKREIQRLTGKVVRVA